VSHAAGGLGDWPDVVAGERAELLRALRSTDEPAVVTDVDEADDVALAKLQLVGVARTVVEQRAQSTQQQQQAAAVLAATGRIAAATAPDIPRSSQWTGTCFQNCIFP